MIYEFDSKIKRLEGKIKWSVIYFPYPTLITLGSKSRIPVLITVDGHSFKHTLLPSKNGHYLVYNEFIKKAVRKGIGESVHVCLEIDLKERKYIVPPHIEKVLASNGVLERYLKQPDYLKREQVNFIEIANKEETKLSRLDNLIAKLKKN